MCDFLGLGEMRSQDCLRQPTRSHLSLNRREKKQLLGKIAFGMWLRVEGVEEKQMNSAQKLN